MRFENIGSILVFSGLVFYWLCHERIVSRDAIWNMHHLLKEKYIFSENEKIHNFNPNPLKNTFERVEQITHISL